MLKTTAQAASSYCSIPDAHSAQNYLTKHNRAACGVVSSLSADAGGTMEGAEADAPAHLDFPGARRRIRTNDVRGRRDREIRRRARVVQSFPSEEALVRLVGAVCCEASEVCLVKLDFRF